MTDLEAYMKESHEHRLSETLYQVLKMKFPDIENLKVEKGNIKFTGGPTKEQVTEFLEQFKKIK